MKLPLSRNDSEATRNALRSRPPKEHGLIVSTPAWRGAALEDGSSMG
jgi:hypothetical protein